MAYVSYLTRDEAAEAVRPVFDQMQHALGVVPNVFRAMAHSPEILQGFLALNSALGRTRLDGNLRELAYMKASQLNGCDYCMHHHVALGRKAGVTEAQIRDLEQFETSPAFDDLQRDVLRYAEFVTRHINPDESLMARLKATLSDREVVELAMTVGLANLTNRVTETLKMELPRSSMRRRGAGLGAPLGPRTEGGGGPGREAKDDAGELPALGRGGRHRLQPEVEPRPDHELRRGRRGGDPPIPAQEGGGGPRRGVRRGSCAGSTPFTTGSGSRISRSRWR